MNTGVEMMVRKGTLTGTQLRIMQIVWSAQRPLTSAEIWQELNAGKPIARTTVVTLVKRLAGRGWLKQEGEARGATFEPTCEQPQATQEVATDFLDRFFGGSPSRFVMSLMGSSSLSEGEAARLRELLADYEVKK